MGDAKGNGEGYGEGYGASIGRAKRFWAGDRVERPLLIFQYDWVSGPRFMPYLGKEGMLCPQDIAPGKFLAMHERIAAESDAIDDDAVPMAEPLVSVPWMEAYCGCGAMAKGHHIWSKKAGSVAGGIDGLVERGADAAWLDQYVHYFKKLKEAFGGRLAVTQPILRGLADIAGALFGEEQVIFGMFDEPAAMRRLFRHLADASRHFFETHLSLLERFSGGYAVGQYQLWAPEKCLRIQDDAMAVLSPSLYREFILPHTEAMAGLADYSLMHLHLTSGPYVDDICKIAGLRALEYDIDEGAEHVADNIGTFRKIQAAGKNLVIKARLDDHDLESLRQLDYSGLCVIPVIYEGARAVEIMKFFGDG